MAWEEQRGVCRAAIIGMISTIAAILLFSMLAGFALSHNRLVRVVHTAIERNDLAYDARHDEDFFTECSLLQMQYLRPHSVLLNTIKTQMIIQPGMHPCQVLRILALGSEIERARLPAPVLASNYFFGARFLEALTLSVFDYRSSQACYQYLSYASIVILFVVMLRHSPQMAIMLSPIPILLLYAFGLPLFGGNLAHAPSFFVGFFALSVLIGARTTFRNVSARFYFFGVLGVVTAYFDLLTGSIPVLFGLSLIAEQFFYSKRKRGILMYISSAIAHGLAIGGCFVVGYALLTLVRLGLLAFIGVALTNFFSELTFRLGTVADNGAVVTFASVVEHLWNVRFQLTPGGAEPATWVLFLALSSWIFAILAFPAALWGARQAKGKLAADILILLTAAGGVIAWYAILPGHTYTHALFAVRTIAISGGCGIAAGILTARHLACSALPKVLIPVIAFTSVVIGFVLIGARWEEGLGLDVTMARLVTAPVEDVVSCAPLGLQPDGQIDGVVEVRYRKAQSPAALFHIYHDHVTYIRLEREHPAGAYETGSTNFVLGISKSVGGKLLNRSDGSLSYLHGREQHLYGHFCRDAHDTPESIYHIDIDGSRSSVAQP